MDISELAECHQENSLEECRALAEESGFTFVGSGSRRKVYIDNDEPDRVYKIQAVGRDNENEVEAHGNFGERAEVLADVFDSGENWISMRRAKGYPTEDIPEAMKSVRSDLRDANVSCKDVNPGNIGVIDGEYRLIDYGWGCTERN